MFDTILRFVLHQKLLVILSVVILLFAGALAWHHLPIDAFPDATNVQVMILTDSPGMTPSEVERLVTFPIEIEMAGLPDVKQVRSLSKSGLSQVVVIFEDKVDIYFARQVVFQRLSHAVGELPEGIEPEMGPVSTGLGEIYQYALESGYYCETHRDLSLAEPGDCPECGGALIDAGLSSRDLRTVQDWLISPQLRRLAGINEVNSFGGRVKQFHVIPDPDLLLKYDIPLRHIVEAVKNNGGNAGGSYVVKDWEQMNVVSKGLLLDIADIEKIVITADDGTPVYLRDIAEVRLGSQTRTGVVTKDGEGEAVLGMAIMLKGENSKEVVDRVREAVPAIQKSLPPGVRMVPFYDRTDLIQDCIRTVSRALGIGMLLIVIILFIILWDIRAAITVALSLPLTAAIAFLLMGWQGVTANLMSLGGLAIAIGMVVDGAIIVTENIARHMRELADVDQSRTEIALAAAKEVARPVTFAILIIVIVFVPLFTLESIEGKMFKPLAITMIFAIVGSLIVALTAIPVLACLLVKRDHKNTREDPLVKAIQSVHVPLLNKAMAKPWHTVMISAAIMVASFAILPFLGTEFLPSLDEGAIAINVVRLPTASLEGSAQQCTAIEQRLLAKFPEISTVVSKTGRAEISEDPMGPEQSDIFIMLKPRKKWKTGRNKLELVEDISKELAVFPGMNPAFSQPIALRVNELISGIKSDVAVKIFGDDIEVLRETAQHIAPILSSVRGAKDIKIEQVSGLLEIQIQIQREQMARHMINASDINSLVETAVGGEVAGVVFEGQKRFDILVRFPEDRRSDIESLSALLVPSPRGYKVPLDELATLSLVSVPAQISREDSTRRLIVECNIRGRDIGTFVIEAQERLAEIEAGLPDGYRLKWGGQFENQQRAMARLKMVVPISVLLIFILLYGALGSLKSAALVMANLPFACVGGILAICLLRINLSVSASIGFIALLGVAVEDGVVLVSFMDHLRARGRNLTDAIHEACRLRVRPMIMTSLTTLLGLLPMLLATGAGSEIQRPLVAVVFGGMISSLLLVLIVLPVLYALVHGYSAKPKP
jgi:cobalt-zinc-cadmium resistance protein CzcA